MAVNVIMPQLGESVAEGTVVRWIKQPGERVERDEPLLEISTDKVDAEIPSPAAGILRRIIVKENETVEVNTVIAEIEDAAAPGEAKSEAKSEAKFESRSDAPNPMAIPAPSDGTTGASPGISERALAHSGTRKTRSSPLVRKIAAEHGVNLERVTGTGLGGRITKKDILDFMAQPHAESPAAVSSAKPAPAAPVEAGQAEPPVHAAARAPQPPPQALEFTSSTKIIPMTPMRRQIAEHMVMSKRTAPHVACVFEAEMTVVARIMAANAAEFEKRNGVKLTYTPFLIRAAVKALKQYPVVNASVDGVNVVYKRDVNIGVAVALETGLIVPVIKQADEKSFLGIARAVADLASRSRAKRLSVEDVQDGTFTISNHGISGSLIGTPIISQPQVAILAVGKIEKRPVVRDDAIAIRAMVYLTLSFDHRIIDGAVADHFMSHIKSSLENWDEPVL